MKNFHRLSENLNVAPIVNALARQPELWNHHRFRTELSNSPHREVDDIWLRFTRLDKRTTLKTALDRLENDFYPSWYFLPQVRNLVFDLFRYVEGIELGKIIITRLLPGRQIYAHSDSGKYAREFDRYHILLRNLPGSNFSCGGEQVFMKTGDAWWFNNKNEHSVVNNSTDERLSLIIDVRPIR